MFISLGSEAQKRAKLNGKQLSSSMWPAPWVLKSPSSFTAWRHGPLGASWPLGYASVVLANWGSAPAFVWLHGPRIGAYVFWPFGL